MRSYFDNTKTLNAYTIMGNEILEGDIFGYKIIAVVFFDNSWCAFRGPTDWDNSRVAKEGDEIPFEVAKYLFSTLANNLEGYGNY